MLDRIRHRALSRWAAVVAMRPVWVLGVALALAAGCGLYAATRLTFQGDRNDLIGKDLEWNRNYIRYRQDFEGKDRVVIVVVVPQEEGGRRKAEAFVDRLDEELSKDERHIKKVWSRIEGGPLLVRLLPTEAYDARMRQMADAGPLLRSHSVGRFVGELTRQLQDDESDSEPQQAVAEIGELQAIVAAIGHAAEGRDPQEALAEAGLDAGPGSDYLTTENGRLMIVDVDVIGVAGEMDPFAPAASAMRQTLARVTAEFPGIEAGLTGIPILEADETEVSMRDSLVASITAVVLISILMAVAFQGVVLPLLSVASLLIGIAWSFGFLTLSIGHLQLLSVVFTVILLGLGIDFAIHVLSRFELVRHEHADTPEGFFSTLLDAMRFAGPGIVTGAVTTAAAFSTTLLTDFKGMAEMGLIAGVGLLLCAASVLGVLPAMMRLWRPHWRHIAPPENRWVDLHADTWVMPFVRHPVPTLLVAAVVVGVSGYGVTHARFDNNLLNMMPAEMDSAQWISRMEQQGQPIWDAVLVTDDLKIAQRWTEALRSKPTVKDVGGIGWLWPQDHEAKLQTARRVRQTLQLDQLPGDSDAKDSVGALKQQLGLLRLGVNGAINRKDVQETPGIAEALTAVRDEIGTTFEKLNGAPESEAKARVEALSQAFKRMRDASERQIREATDPKPLTLEELPPYLRRECVSKTEPVRYAVKAYPRDDVWDPDSLAAFIADVREVHPDATGSPVQIHESGLLMQRSYRFAGALAVAVVFVLVMLDFWSLTYAVLCMAPVGLGFVLTFGVMWLAGVSINPANLMVLPLLFGIGVASGVHMMHRYRQSPQSRPLGLADGTGKSILLTSLTTIIAFASMLPAEHRGIRSLGFVLAVGIAMTLLVCMTVMPALLELRTRFHAIHHRGTEGTEKNIFD